LDSFKNPNNFGVRVRILSNVRLHYFISTLCYYCELASHRQFTMQPWAVWLSQENCLSWWTDIFAGKFKGRQCLFPASLPDVAWAFPLNKEGMWHLLTFLRWHQWKNMSLWLLLTRRTNL
jgi:hypothetical protein